jgi:hypothetical protein
LCCNISDNFRQYRNSSPISCVKMVKDSAKISFFIFAILLILAIYNVKPANAVLECQVRSGGCLADEFPLLRMSDTNNAHAGFETVSSYNNKICCKDSLGIVNVGYSCSGNTDTFLYLQGADNSHVEENSGGAQNYSNKACISVDQGSIVCSYESGSCSAGTSCLASISGPTNAHIGDCNAYSEKICCGITYPYPTCSLDVSNTSINLGDSVTLTWSSNYALTATSNFGETSLSGSKDISPTTTTTYIFTVNNPFAGGGTSCNVTVTVNTPSAPTCVLSVVSPSSPPPNPQVTGNQAYKNEDSILSWTITGTATSATLTDIPGSFNPGASGSITINISGDKTYTMTVDGPGGSGTCSLDVIAIDCVSSCPGGCGDTGQIDSGCGGTCPDNTGNSCDDGNACTDTDVCNAIGECAGTPTNCGDNASCNDSDGSCICDNNYVNCDGDWSNGCEINTNNDTNNCGICGNSCDDGNVCTTDVCSEGSCSWTPITCGDNASCSGGSCVCDAGYTDCDGDWSNGCEINTNNDTNNCGICGNSCDDGNVCTTDVCFGGACNNSNNTNNCNDINACTDGDVCSEGSCAGTIPVTCDSPPNNQCYNLTGSCDPATGCVYTQKPDGTLCNDGNDETMGDICSAGVCQAGGYKSIPEFIKDATKWLLGFAVSLALIVIIIAGIVYNSSSGDENKTRIAKGLLKYAIMGLLVSGVSYAIIVVLDKIL